MICLRENQSNLLGSGWIATKLLTMAMVSSGGSGMGVGQLSCLVACHLWTGCKFLNMGLTTRLPHDTVAGFSWIEETLEENMQDESHSAFVM